MANIRYSDAVFKIPDGGRVIVNKGGDVPLSVNKVKLNAYKSYYKIRYGQEYRYGWLNKSYFESINAYTKMWSSLFDKALLIHRSIYN